MYEQFVPLPEVYFIQWGQMMEVSVEVHGVTFVSACSEDDVLPKIIHNWQVIGEIHCGNIIENTGKFLVLHYLVVKGGYK